MGVMALVEVSEPCGCTAFYRGGERIGGTPCPPHAAEHAMSKPAAAEGHERPL